MATAKSTQKDLNLYQRILNTQATVEYLRKDLDVPVSKDGKKTVAGLSHNHVVANVRDAAIKAGLVILPCKHEGDLETSSRQVGNGFIHNASVMLSIDLINADDPDQTKTVTYRGDGTSWSSMTMAIESAYSYALKTALLKTFLVPAGWEDENPYVSAEPPQNLTANTAETTNVPESKPDMPVSSGKIETIEAKAKDAGIDINRVLATASSQFDVTKFDQLTEPQADKLIGGLDWQINNKGSVA